MIIPVPENGASILPACRQQNLQSPRVLFLLAPYIQFFRKSCQFHLQSMYGIHSSLPWPHPDPAHPLLSSLGPLPQPHHLSAPPLTTNSLSHKKPEGACEHLNQVKSLPRLLRTFPWCHTSKSRKGGKAAGAFLALTQPSPVFCFLFFFWPSF